MGRQLSVRTQSLSLLLLIALIGLNLRPFLVSPGPLLGSIVNDTGLSYPQASMLTLLPMMLMGFGAFVVAARPALIGSHVGLLLALGLMTLGSALRYFVSDGSTLIITALLCGVGVAFIQSILPGMIKQFFAQHSAVVTGLYSASLMIGGALGAQLMPILLQRGYRWQHALALLALPCFAALVAAWVVLNQRKQMPEQCDALPEVSQAPLSVPQLVSEAILSPLPLKRLLARPRTWTLMAAFGIVNGGYASLVTWLAPFYQQRGWDHASSSHLIVVMAVTQALFAIGLPALARGYTDRRPWLLLVLVMQAIGFLGFAFYPDIAPHLWSILCGAGLGGAFSLTIVTALEHLPAVKSAGALTALMQGGGFLIAAAFPFMFALLLQWSGDFCYGWMMHLLMVITTMFICIRFNPKHYDDAMC